MKYGRTFTMQMSPSLRDHLQDVADQERRSVAQVIHYALEQLERWDFDVDRMQRELLYQQRETLTRGQQAQGQAPASPHRSDAPEGGSV
jgi:predicted transcriptional regulator